jgi:hypothetical protein
VAEHLVGDLAVAVGAFAHREIAAAALLAFAADDRKGNNDPVSRFELPVLRAHLDHFAHEFMAHDVAAHHARDEAVEEVQVGAADRARRHFDDRVARILDLRVGNGVAADVLLAVPAECFHGDIHRNDGFSRARDAPGIVLAAAAPCASTI